MPAIADATPPVPAERYPRHAAFVILELYRLRRITMTAPKRIASASSARITVRLGNDRRTVAEYRRGAWIPPGVDWTPANGWTNADTNVVRVHPDSVELLMSKAARPGTRFRKEIIGAFVYPLLGWLLITGPIWLITFIICAVLLPWPGLVPPLVAVIVGIICVLCYAALVYAAWPHVRRMVFTPADRPTHVEVRRGRRVQRMPIAALSAITIVEHHEGWWGTTAAGIQPDPTSGWLRWFDVVLHRTDGSFWLVRGLNDDDRLPDSDMIYSELAPRLASTGVTVRRSIRRHQARRPAGWFSGGSGSANSMGC